MINSKKNIIFIIGQRFGSSPAAFYFLFLFLFFIPFSSFSDTLKNDLKINLTIEIGDETNDFNDANKTVEKGRIITYKIDITNHGDTYHHPLIVLFEAPDYMTYLPNSTQQISHVLPDIENRSALATGYVIEGLGKDQSTYFTMDFQVDSDILDEEVYAAAWASLMDTYQPIPLITSLVETRISGEPTPLIQVITDTLPSPGQMVFEGSQIVYQYTLRNIGGLVADDLTFTPYLPDHTSCINGCDPVDLGNLASSGSLFHIMTVEVGTDLEGISEIKNIGHDLEAFNIELIENRDSIIHPLDGFGSGQEGDFVVEIHQRPDIVLNSPNGELRADGADITETFYSMSYTGRQKPHTYPTLSSTETYTYPNENHSCAHTYPFLPGTLTYAYNSQKISTCDESEEGCELELESQPITFQIDTNLPQNAPRLEFVTNETSYTHPQNTYAVNRYMQRGGLINIPETLTLSRAVQNGSIGAVETKISATISEDVWRYEKTNEVHHICRYSCGEDTCEMAIYKYAWNKASQTSVTLLDEDDAPIQVYTSTAWLKTEKGHLGTNDHVTNEDQTLANYVDIPHFADNHLTPSLLYTPPDEFNADYLIFAQDGWADFKTPLGEPWQVRGTEFGELSSGIRSQDRASFQVRETNLLKKELFGKVRTNELPSVIQESLDIQDATVWHQEGDLILGSPGQDLSILGGQSRIYVDGDVYINGNLFYQETAFNEYNQITNLRIDAENIYVAGHVTDIESLLLARNAFYSDESKTQLRILGDVISGKVEWQRQPLLQKSPEQFNQPSEHIIEDMRKYVMPAPGDTQFPEDPIWRQVNVGTGEMVDHF